MPGDQRCRRFASEAELAGLWEVLFVFFFCRAKMVGKEKVYKESGVFSGYLQHDPFMGSSRAKENPKNS